MLLPVSSPACPRAGASSAPAGVVKDFGGAVQAAVSALWGVFPLNSHLEHIGQKESKFLRGGDEKLGSALTSLPAARAGCWRGGGRHSSMGASQSLDYGPPSLAAVCVHRDAGAGPAPETCWDAGAGPAPPTHRDAGPASQIRRDAGAGVAPETCWDDRPASQTFWDAGAGPASQTHQDAPAG